MAVRCITPEDVRRLPEHPGCQAILPLSLDVLDRLADLTRALIEHHPPQVVLAWPLPGAGVRVPSVDDALRRGTTASQELSDAGIAARLTGLPACLDRRPVPLHRTRNRFYVDADHQLDDALLFFPDIVEFAKPDTCRSCTETAWCDGIARHWLDRGVVGIPQPIAPGRAGG